MNEDLIEKIALFIERQCPRKLFPSMNGSKCDKYGCSVHWMAAQVRDRKFEQLPIIPAQADELTEGVLR